MPAGIVTCIDADGAAPAARGPTSRAPRNVSETSSAALADRYTAVLDGPASAPPELAVMSHTVSVAPSPAVAGVVKLEIGRPAPVADGTVSEDTIKSGGTSSLTIVTLALLGVPTM